MAHITNKDDTIRIILFNATALLFRLAFHPLGGFPATFRFQNAIILSLILTRTGK